MSTPTFTSPRRRTVKALLIVVLSLLVAWAIVQLVGQIDWAAVVDATRKLHWWQVPILLVVLFVRQVLNASPLAIFIRGLGVFRAVINDQTAILLSMIAPPPSDLVMRIAMFRSWGIESSRGLAGAVMNTVAFYVTRFAVPILGFVLILPHRFDIAYACVALVSGLLALLILVGLLAVMAREELAARAGVLAGQTVRRVRASVDPDAWAASTVRFRWHVVGKIRAGLPRALLVLVLMVLCDALLLTLALRFVGVSASAVPVIEIFAIFLVAYPLTLLPISGLGVLDAVILAALVEVGGLQVEPAAVAGLIVWRVVTVLTPLAMGVASIAFWRSRPGHQELAESHPSDVVSDDPAKD
ncbi:lysylphosphatidylglycerol synthase domain-containing protein [Aeromicrobium sp. UC242_57]|uniref:lysylphosphatidylglycerol synthase domain-containing protein n=1 Tax=Aeromicrobium sp. UC242_57 TaxID=3374624 RepID=UPI0037ABD1E7